jgi:hypothetical protein
MTADEWPNLRRTPLRLRFIDSPTEQRYQGSQTMRLLLVGLLTSLVLWGSAHILVAIVFPDAFGVISWALFGFMYPLLAVAYLVSRSASLRRFTLHVVMATNTGAALVTVFVLQVWMHQTMLAMAGVISVIFFGSILYRLGLSQGTVLGAVDSTFYLAAIAFQIRWSDIPVGEGLLSFAQLVEGGEHQSLTGCRPPRKGEELMSPVIASIPIVLFAIALVLGISGAAVPGGHPSLTPLAQWILLVALGLQCLWASFSHIFAAERVAKSIGWQTSPFQPEVGGANLGIGLAGIAAAVLGEPAGWVVFLMAASFLWGAALVHVRDMIRAKNFAINNAGPIFWWDVLTPATLLIGLVL